MDDEVAEDEVGEECGGGDVGAGHHDALCLHELLDGEVGGVREDLRGEAV